MSTLSIQIEKAWEEKKRKSIKCVVWDLDNTIWDGVLLEDGPEGVTPRSGIAGVIKVLDERGILQSIASKNEHDAAMRKLEELGLAEYFLYPQIHWSSKAESVKQIAKSLNLGLDSIAFVDDQEFEREEVAYSIAEVLCIDAAETVGLLERPEMMPRFITDESVLRRPMYRSDMARNRAEESFMGPHDEFLATLGMKFTLGAAREEDLKRAEELTQRTHQLNTTGYTYSYDELDAFRLSAKHRLLIAGLEDKYGMYGKIGLGLVECGEDHWTLKLLLMSCRVMSRGVGTVMMNHIMREARAAGVPLRAEFIATPRNRMMNVTYRLGNFKVAEQRGDLTILEHDCQNVPADPAYIDIRLTS